MGDEDPARGPAGYAIPYYTRDGGDTEYLISNPGPGAVNGSLVLYDAKCRPAGRPVPVKLAPQCTQSVLVRPIVPDNAGHSVLSVDGPLLISILYTRAGDLAVVGNALVGSDALVPWAPGTKHKTYGFGYRTLPPGSDTLDGSLFVSNPGTTNLAGLLTPFDERCQRLSPQKFAVKPGCTRELVLPAGHYGYGLIRVSVPAVLNLLHFAKSAGGLTAAELLGEPNAVREPPPPGAGLLIDYTHGCRGVATGDTGAWEAALTAAGHKVDHLTAPAITYAALQPYKAFAVMMPRTGYSYAETQAILDFVNAGGGLLVAQDFGVDPAMGGPMPWSWPVRSVLGAFGLIDDNNLALDALHNDGPVGGHVIFSDAQHCFAAHPIVSGLKSIVNDATCTFSTAAGWTTVVETDADAVPPNQPVTVERSVGAGRVVVLGDSNVFTDVEQPKYDNAAFTQRCVERVLFKI